MGILIATEPLARRREDARSVVPYRDIRMTYKYSASLRPYGDAVVEGEDAGKVPIIGPLFRETSFGQGNQNGMPL